MGPVHACQTAPTKLGARAALIFWQSAQLIEGGLEAEAKKKKRNTPRPKKGIPHVPQVPRVDRFYSIQLLVHYWILKNGSTRGTWGRWGRQNGWVPFMLAKPHRPSSVRAQLFFFWQSAQVIEGRLEAEAKKKKRHPPPQKRPTPCTPSTPS